MLRRQGSLITGALFNTAGYFHFLSVKIKNEQLKEMLSVEKQLRLVNEKTAWANGKFVVNHSLLYDFVFLGFIILLPNI